MADVCICTAGEPTSGQNVNQVVRCVVAKRLVDHQMQAPAKVDATLEMYASAHPKEPVSPAREGRAKTWLSDTQPEAQIRH